MKKIFLSLVMVMISIMGFGQDLTFNSEQNFELSKVVEITGSKDQIYGAIMEHISPKESKNRSNIFIDKELGTIKFTDKIYIGMLNSNYELVFCRSNIKFHIKDNKYKVTFET